MVLVASVLKQLKPMLLYLWSAACEHMHAGIYAAERWLAWLRVLCYLSRLRAKTPDALRRGFVARALNTKAKSFV